MQETLMQWQLPSVTHPVATRRHPMVSSLTLQSPRHRVLCRTVSVNCNLIPLSCQWSPCTRASQWQEESKPKKVTASISRLFTTMAQAIYSSTVEETCLWLSRCLVNAGPSTNSNNKTWSRHIRRLSSDLLIGKRSEACTATWRSSSISLVTRIQDSVLKQSKWMSTFRRKRKKSSSSRALSSSSQLYCTLVVTFPSLKRPTTLNHS